MLRQLIPLLVEQRQVEYLPHTTIGAVTDDGSRTGVARCADQWGSTVVSSRKMWALEGRQSGYDVLP